MKMEKRVKWMLVLLLASGLFLAGCATDITSGRTPHWEKQSIEVLAREYIVHGTVRVERDWFGILGISLPAFPPITTRGFDFYLVQRGGASYFHLLDEAQAQFPEANAVIHVKIDFEDSSYFGVFARRRVVMTGIAVQFKRDPPPPNPAMDIHLR